MFLEQAPIKIELCLEDVSDTTLQVKLLEMGFSIGSKIQLIRRAPFNGPYTIGNHKSQVILRKEDARLISVSKLN
ncbi:MAG: ferrous iron transport protein A [Crocinitomicaceae bacterium]|nr:ferrous iron transport protein A [Crocinitomicaceae bacterium]|tara:strand:- start:15871 stop:16095 length:225 start_codon:yes stop_codon:yes gene_type:complete